MSSQGRHHGRTATDGGDYNYGSGNGGDNIPAPLLGGKADFNADFASQFQSGKRGTTGRSSTRDEATQPILQGNEDYYDASTPMKGARPNSVQARSKTTGAAPSSAAKIPRKTAKFFGMGMGGGNNSAVEEQILSHEEKSAEYKAPITIGKRKIAVWPYDDYH